MTLHVHIRYIKYRVYIYIFFLDYLSIHLYNLNFFKGNARFVLTNQLRI